MTQPDVPLRKRSWKPLLIFLALFSAAILALYLWISQAADRKWAKMEQAVRALVAELEQRDSTRPVPYGETFSGNGWSAYEMAASFRSKSSSLDKELASFRTAPNMANLEIVRQRVQAYAAAIDHLRRGAHHASAYWRSVGEKGIFLPRGSIPIYPIELALLCQGHLLRLDGHPGEALRALLDLQTITQDDADYYADLHEIHDELAALLLKESLSQQDLQVLETALERAELSPNNGQWHGVDNLAHDGSILLAGHTPLDRNRDGGWDVWPSWRYGFSRRLQRADAFLALVPLAKAQATLQGEALRLFQKDWGSLHFQNRIAGFNYPYYQRTWKLQPYDLTRLRLLRMGARFKRTGEVLKLKDPFGDWLHQSIQGSEGKLWSVGSDKKDDGGSGAFALSPGMGPQPDIVLTLRR